MPAAAGRDGVRVVDAETAAHQAIYEVDGRAADVHGAGRVHEQAHAVDLDKRIVLLRTFLESHAVLQTGAAATRHEDAQRVSRDIPCLKQFLDFTRRDWRNRQNWGFGLYLLKLTNFDYVCHGLSALP